MLNRGIIISASNKCFLQCTGCYNYFGNTDYKTADLIDFLKTLSRSIRIKKVTVGGGEPLLRTDLIPMLQELKEMDMSISLDSVGMSLIDGEYSNIAGNGKRFQNLMEHVDCIGIPLDGSTDGIIRYFRNGLHLSDIETILQAVNNCDADIEISINTVVHRGNINDLINIHKTISNYRKITKWQLFQYMPIGPSGYRFRKRFEIEESLFTKRLDELRKSLNGTGRQFALESKSLSDRKNKYILIGGDGIVWIPDQNQEKYWSEDDANDNRKILGNIRDTGAITPVLRLIDPNSKPNT